MIGYSVTYGKFYKFTKLILQSYFYSCAQMFLLFIIRAQVEVLQFIKKNAIKTF